MWKKIIMVRKAGRYLSLCVYQKFIEKIKKTTKILIEFFGCCCHFTGKKSIMMRETVCHSNLCIYQKVIEKLEERQRL
jgi:hypothetical protein